MTAVKESVDEFRGRAKAWLAANMPLIDPAQPPSTRLDQDASWQRARDLQKRLYEGGFAGICFASEYGGLGLAIEYQKAFNAESRGYEMPLILNIPSLTICCATLLDVASEEQKRQHIAAALRGDEVLAQLLSEPSGGSDLAGVTTRADRQGDTWIINGAKTWSTSAFAADYGLCLVRTDWEVRHGLPLLRAASWARIVTLSAHSIQRQSPSLVAYTASKAALSSLTKNLSKSLAAENILVNCVCPGTFVTASFTESLGEVLAADGLDASDPNDVMRWVDRTFHHPCDLGRAALRRRSHR